MGIRINYGTSKKKNTRVCIKEINAALMSNPDAKLILIVPEPYSSYYEKLLVEKSSEKGSFRAEILTFKRLAYRIFAKYLHNNNKYLDSAGKSMLMYDVVSGMTDEFIAYSKSGKYPSFAIEAVKSIREFKRYKVTPEILEETVAKTSSGLLKRKIVEMALVYRAYEDKLSQGGFSDADDNMTDLAMLINKNSDYKDTMVWFDGFDGFTPAEMDVVSALMNNARACTFSLCCKSTDLPPISDVFHPVVKTFIKVQKAAQLLGYKIIETNIKPDSPESSGIPGELEHLAGNYFGYPGKLYTGNMAHVKIYKASSIYEEINRCALEITTKVRNGEMRYGDICVVSGLYEEYREYIDAIFSKYDIPVFLDEKRSIAKHPVAAYLLSLLDIYINKYSYESVLTYLKSSYTGLSADEISILENYILQWDIKGRGMWTGQDWDFYTDEGDNDNKLTRLNEIRKKITGVLEEIFEKIKYGRTADEFIEEIYRFLVNQGIFEKIKYDASRAEQEGRLDYADELKQSWNILMDIFNQIHIVASEGKHTAEKYRIMLELALQQKKIGVIPPRTDAVFAGKISKAYGNDAKMLMILGANDPGFPDKFMNEGLLTDKDRADILEAGIELAPDTKTQVLNSLIDTYNLLNIPTLHLYASYSQTGTDGSARRKSVFFDRMEDLFEKYSEQDGSLMRKDDFIVNPLTGLDALLFGGENLEHLLRWYRENDYPTVVPDHVDSIPGIDFHDVIKELLGESIESSPTSIEKYVSCPYKYFAGNALEARPVKEYRISPPDVGSILHGILKRLVDEHISDMDSDYEKYMNEATAELGKMKFHKIFQRDSRHEYLGKRIIRRAVDSFLILKDQINKGEFKPVVLEASFGRNKSIEAPRFSADDHSIYLNGRIDRVDGAIIGEEEYFRIIDYKSSDMPLKLYKINSGLDIQLGSYMMAYEMHSGTKPAGMYYFTTNNNLVTVDYGVKTEEIKESIFNSGKMEGYTLNDPQVIRAMDREIEGFSTIIPVKYNPKKDEYSNKVLDSVEISAMTKRIGEIISENTRKIFDCDFPVKPANTEKPACTYCEYNKICGFDIRRPDCSYRQIRPINDKDVVWGKDE